MLEWRAIFYFRKPAILLCPTSQRSLQSLLGFRETRHNMADNSCEGFKSSFWSFSPNLHTNRTWKAIFTPHETRKITFLGFSRKGGSKNLFYTFFFVSAFANGLIFNEEHNKPKFWWVSFRPFQKESNIASSNSFGLESTRSKEIELVSNNGIKCFLSYVYIIAYHISLHYLQKKFGRKNCGRFISDGYFSDTFFLISDKFRTKISDTSLKHC